AIDFDADGRMWVLEMPGFMSGPGGANSREPINDVVVLEDLDGDGVMDKRTVFADDLVLPRAFKVLDKGVLVGEPPNLWFMKDTDGDLKADTKDLVSDTYGRAAGSIEHNANSLFWGLDNVIYTSEHDWHLQLKDGRFETIPTLARGQWGASMDDAGRIYRNVNDAPLFTDFVAARYYARNPHLARTRGLYEPLITREASVIWPVRQTRGVNRGYRDQFFRPDDSSVTIQGVGTPVVYRGDRLPKELYGNAFITDSTTNLVHRYKIVDDGTGRLKAVDGYAKGEILASWDERFRPVNMLGGPDGTLYIVDMYRGIVQEQIYWTDFLRHYVNERDLVAPVKLGRIWRLVHETTKRDRTPELSTATPAELVKALSHPNGWWRDTAQQLLVQRNAKEVAPQLKQLAAAASTDWRTKLHALWTLDGLDAIEIDSVQRALGDTSPDVRASAIRLSERWIAQPNHPLAATVLKLMDDSSWTVRRQLGATIGELPAAARVAPGVALLTRYGADPILVDATISGLRGSEAGVLLRVMSADPHVRKPDPVSMLTAAVARSGDLAAVEQILGRVTDAATSPAARLALLQGLDTGLPSGSGGRGGRGTGGGRGAPAAAKVTLRGEPVALVTLTTSDGEAGALAKRVVAKLEWPGKPAPVVDVPPLTPAEEQQFAAGAEVYENICLGCHQADGRGKEKMAPTLVESRYTIGEPTAAMRILLAGKEGPIGLMPPLGGALNDEQIASVLTYIRREWGNTGSAVAPEDVTEIRGLTKNRTRPWTDAELTEGRGGRRSR
ncbi:MAG: DUF7133 domain-containing protein, partial [Vicinamibacterales bacterium]